MPAAVPHFQLRASGTANPARWQFNLEVAGQTYLEVDDFEPFTQGQRLELLAVVRGLEALEQPSRVTLLTPSNYVKRGITYGLDDWRSSGWCWESHGKMVPVKNSDLWRRLDRALEYHHVECRLQPDRADGIPAATGKPKREAIYAATDAKPMARSTRWLIPAICRWFRERAASVRLRLAQLGTGLLPRPWLE
jgi:ribonuclease HI